MLSRVPLSVEIVASGCYVPERVLSNHDLEGMVETSDEWITQRTGIKERRLAAEGEATSDVAIRAARNALEAAGIESRELDMIIVATCTPDYMFPATACLVQSAIGARNAVAFDLEAACSGFLYAFSQSASAIASGTVGTALIIGAECLSRFTDYEDRRSCILFGDGAGAAVIRASRNGGKMIYTELGSDGSRPEILVIPAGGARLPASEQTVREKLHYMKLEGSEVFRWAVNKLTELMLRIPEETGISLDQIKLIIPHQSNARIIRSACERTGIDIERAYMNIDRYGNTSAASVPIAMHEALERGKMVRGDLVLLLAFGGGVTWGSMLLRY